MRAHRSCFASVATAITYTNVKESKEYYGPIQPARGVLTASQALPARWRKRWKSPRVDTSAWGSISTGNGNEQVNMRFDRRLRISPWHALDDADIGLTMKSS
jgi:hypothetical protein